MSFLKANSKINYYFLQSFFLFGRKVNGTNLESTLNDILFELENDEDAPVFESITFLPPENYDAAITDENHVQIQNLLGNQLRTPAQIHYENPSDESDSDDSIPLAEVVKRRRISVSSIPLESESLQISFLPSTSKSVSIPKTKSYNWISRDIKSNFEPWKEMQQKTREQSELYYFEQLFNDKIIDLLVQYTNMYISQKNTVGNVTSDEMKCFIGILLFSGYVVVPRRYMFWEKSGISH